MSQDASMKNTKKELLEIITTMQKEMEEKEKSLLNPEKVKIESKSKETINQAKDITQSDVISQIDKLKASISKELTVLAEKIENEAKKYATIQKSIELKQAELKDIYGIEAQAATLAAILESNRREKERFESEVAGKREQLESEIRDTQHAWEEEKKKRDKEREREEEEYGYALQRSRAVEKNEYADKLAAIEKEIQEKKEQCDRKVDEQTTLLNEREQRISDRENIMDKLERRVDNFSTELQEAVDLAVEQKNKELTAFYEHEKALLVKGYEGEHNVLEAKIDALESLVKSQAKQLEKLENQQEKAYQQVQDIAAKAVAGAAERPHSITVKPYDGEGQ